MMTMFCLKKWDLKNTGVCRELKMRHLVIFIAALLTCCQTNAGPPGHIVVRNDILDKTYNQFTVDNVIADSGLTGFRVVLKPGTKKTIPNKNIREMRFTRRYKDYSLVYIVKCPPLGNESVLIKLIDVHSDRMDGGCELSKKGKRGLGGVIQWE